MFNRCERIVPWGSDYKVRTMLGSCAFWRFMGSDFSSGFETIPPLGINKKLRLLLPIPVFSNGAVVQKVWLQGDPRRLFRRDYGMYLDF